MDAIQTTTHGVSVHFICDPDDAEEIRAVETDGRAYLHLHAGNYASKITHGVKQTDEPLIFTGADDLNPHPHWLEQAEAHLTEAVQVVGVNDLIPRRRVHTTHFLMTRAYARQPTIDGKPGPFFHGYRHWFCDDELIATAKHRNAYSYAADSMVEHLHPMAGKAPEDAIYALGREHWKKDRKRFQRRERLWTLT